MALRMHLKDLVRHNFLLLPRPDGLEDTLHVVYYLLSADLRILNPHYKLICTEAVAANTDNMADSPVAAAKLCNILWENVISAHARNLIRWCIPWGATWKERQRTAVQMNHTPVRSIIWNPYWPVTIDSTSGRLTMADRTCLGGIRL